MPPRTGQHTPATALTVLRVLAAHGPQTLQELARRAGLHLRSAYRWVEYVEQAGVPVRQEPTWPRRYHVDALDLMAWIGAARGKRRRS